jgi:hypothetical protein
MEPQWPHEMMLLRPDDISVIRLMGICEMTPQSLNAVSRLVELHCTQPGSRMKQH